MSLVLKQMQSLRPEGFGAINRLEANLDGKMRIFPELCANQEDYARSEKNGIPVNAEMFNYHYWISEPKIGDLEIKEIRSEFQRIKEKYRPQVTSMSFTPQKRIVLDDNSKARLLDLQRNLGTTFITDIESDREQSCDQFIKELDIFDRYETNQVKSPTINLRMEATEEFEQKAKALVADERFVRINVHWGGYGDHKENWSSVLKHMTNSSKWCNMVGSPRRTRRDHPPIKSHIAHGLVYGMHTFCFGKDYDGDDAEVDDGKSFVLDGQSWHYRDTENDYNADISTSFNVAQGELKKLGKMDSSEAFEYLGSRPGLYIQQSL